VHKNLIRKNSMICRLQLIQFLSTVCSVPSAWRGFGGLSPPNKAPSPQIGTWNTTVYQWSFCQFLEYQAPRTNANLPYWKLSSDGFESAHLLLIHLLSTRRPILPKWNKRLNTYVRSGIASLKFCMGQNQWRTQKLFIGGVHSAA